MFLQHFGYEMHKHCQTPHEVTSGSCDIGARFSGPSEQQAQVWLVSWGIPAPSCPDQLPPGPCGGTASGKLHCSEEAGCHVDS